MRVLVVEDDQEIQNVLSILSSEAGFQVTSTEDGEIALLLLRMVPEKFDLVFLDLKLPNVNGSKILDSLAENDSRLCVVVVSGQENGFRWAKHPAVSSFIPKPFSLVDINTALQMAKQVARIKKEVSRASEKILRDP